MVIELCVVQFWSEITRMILDQIALHLVQLPLFMVVYLLILLERLSLIDSCDFFGYFETLLGILACIVRGLISLINPNKVTYLTT